MSPTRYSQTMNYKRVIAVLAVTVVLVLSLSACGGTNTAAVPKCKPNAVGCKQVYVSGSSNDAWVPLVYWTLLFNQQGLTGSSTPTYQSSVPSSVAPSSSGVASDELQDPPEASDDEPSSSSEDDVNSDEENATEDDDSFSEDDSFSDDG